jgi:hypothetical protein
LAPKKGFRKSNPEHSKASKVNLDLNGDTKTLDLERKLRKSTISQRHPLLSKGKITSEKVSHVLNEK